MVGDSLRRDYEGARRSGLGFIWIAPRDVQGAGRAVTQDGSILGTVSDLPDILDILT
jgi:FMN phosphatase YigB (HAD superfamily)